MSKFTDGRSPTVVGILKRPLDLYLCPQLNWGCRFLRVDHRTLVGKVWDEKLVAALRAGSKDTAKAVSAIEGVVLRDRPLRFAVLDESRLYAADLIGADLRKASLTNAALPGARLTRAQLQGADLVGAQLQGANLSAAQLQGADARNALMWHAVAPKEFPAELAFADLRGTDFTSQPKLDDLLQSVAAIPDKDRRLSAEKWLRDTLSPEASGRVLSVTASASQPVLTDAPAGSPLDTDPKWLISTPTPGYVKKRAAYLADLAASDPATAAGIARNVANWMQGGDPIALAVACHLLADGKLQKGETDRLHQALKQSQQSCPP